MAVPPPGQDFFIAESDLAFILKQIEIAEAHAEDVVTENANSSPLCSNLAVFDEGLDVQTWFEPDGDPCVGSALLPHGLRTVDGRWNNLQPGQSYYGASDQLFPRLLEPEFRAADAVPPFAPTIPGQPTNPTSYGQNSGFVYDSEPRTISNLAVDQTTDNPAAVEVLLRYLEDGLDARIIDDDGNELPIPENPTAENLPEGRIFLQNVASDEGLSAPFSSWFTIFGQFFDHGLDLVEKGGSGTIVIPLQPDDPLYVPPTAENPNPPNFLMLTRATNQAGDDNILGTDDDLKEHRNRTTPFIDQNQTYTSHASHQFFLREYEFVDGRPVATGRLLDGDDGGLATWADIKDQALNVLGIALNDYDVVNVPLIVTDPYGRFVADPATGFPIVITTEGAVVASLASPIQTGEVAGGAYVSYVERANHSFLDDIAHTAAPFTSRGDPLSRGLNDPEQVLDPETEFDGPLLDAHVVTGDGRGNENIALTAIHHVFHSEHNRLVGQIESVLATASPELQAGYAADGYWDRNERLFQAARFINEMEYQHLAVEEFVRRVQPTVDNPPLNESAYHSELNAAISAEFAHVVYRFGHSMLTETLPRTYADGTHEEMTLLDAFLNPHAFTKNGTLTPDEATASLVRGLTLQPGNAIDEFVTETLRNELLGLPLDLATINLARGRDVGVPPLQEARATFYAVTQDPTLEPYESWEDYRLSMKHPESVVNFVAAYGIHPSLEGLTSIADRRAAAEALVADEAFMNAPAEETGLNDVDFWIGGLAERVMPFGGMLGSTFNFVFESQAEHLQNADRFYYLTRNQGRNLFTQLEANSFSELVQRNTDATGLPADVFAFPDPVFYLDQLPPCPEPLPADSGLSWMTDCTLRFTGGEHIVMYGTNNPDRMRAGDGDDSMWGRAGADRLEGGAGNDSIFGGDGDDIITDIFGDDTIIAGGGNDAVRGGPGADLLLPGTGNDFTYHTAEITQSFSGPGNDFARGGAANDQMWGNEGDDWLEGANGHDLVQGDHAIVFQNDPNGGADVLIGGPGNNDLDSDGGDDILVLGPGVDRAEGMLGFDWAIHKGQTTPVNADMRFNGLLPPDLQAFRDRFDFIEGLSGWNGNDVLRGTGKAGDLPETAPHGHFMDEDHLDLIEGLRDLLQPPGHINYAVRFMDPSVLGLPVGDSDGYSNIILGGAGSDLIEGREGDDFVDGDAWLNVQIEWRNPDTDESGWVRLDGMTDMVPLVENGQLVERQLGDRVFRGEINPGDLHIVRSIAMPGEETDVIDTAVYANNFDTYTIVDRGDGYFEVTHAGADEVEESEGRDIIRNIEQLLFADGCVRLEAGFPRCPSYGTITFDHQNPVEDEPIVATVEFNDQVENPTSIQFSWQFGEEGEGWDPSPNDVAAPDPGAPPYRNTFHPGDVESGYLLRVIVTFTDDDGQLRSIISDAVANEVVGINDDPVGPVITPSNPTVGTMLQAGQLSDGDGMEEVIEDATIAWTWQHNQGDGSDAWTDVATGPDPYFLVTPAQSGRQIRVVVTYTDDGGTNETATSDPTEVVPGDLAPNAAPTGSLTLSTSGPTEGVAITADASSVDDADGLGAFSWTWEWSPDGTSSWQAVDGADGSTFTPVTELVGTYLRATVTYTDGAGWVEAVSSAIVGPVAEATAPNAEPTGEIVLAGAAQVGLALTADTSTLSDPDGLGELGFQWERSLNALAWNPIAGATEPTYTPDPALVGQLIRVAITYVDGKGTTETVTSSPTPAVLGADGEPLPFADIAGSTFVTDILWLYQSGITGGCVAPDPETGTGGQFCPTSPLTRAQMAAFLDRALDLPDAPADYDAFVDDAGMFEANIEALAFAGITGGCDTDRFCPTSPLTRAQMAAFLDRALDLPDAPADYDPFDDDAGMFEANIEALANSGITGGCAAPDAETGTGGKFCPTSPLTRAQMAAFLHRALE